MERATSRTNALSLELATLSAVYGSLGLMTVGRFLRGSEGRYNRKMHRKLVPRQQKRFVFMRTEKRFSLELIRSNPLQQAWRSSCIQDSTRAQLSACRTWGMAGSEEVAVGYRWWAQQVRQCNPLAPLHPPPSSSAAASVLWLCCSRPPTQLVPPESFSARRPTPPFLISPPAAAYCPRSRP